MSQSISLTLTQQQRLLFACWVILHAFFPSASFRNNIRVSNHLDPDQARRFVGVDLGPNCLQMISAADTNGKEL